MHRRRLLAGALAGFAALPLARGARAQTPPSPSPAPAVGDAALAARASPAAAGPAMELALVADAPSTPTGLAISPEGRVFVMMPRFTGKEPYTVGEVFADGRVAPYPDLATNAADAAEAQAHLLHVTNGVFDTAGGLWLLDAGLPNGSGPPAPGGAKLVRIDLASDRIDRTIPLSSGVEPTSSLNDLRVDTKDGRTQAFVTDQGQDGRGAILAVDLATGRVARRLHGHASTQSQPGVLKIVEGRPLMTRRSPGAPAQGVQGGANGIALSPDGARLYYAPLMGRHLYAVATADLLDETVSDAAVAAGVEDLGEKGFTGGLGCDAEGRVYLAMQELNAVGRRDEDGTIAIVGTDPRLVWADTIAITPDGWLYVSGAQVNRRPEYNEGRDLQRPPYAILRVRIDAGPAQ